MDYILQSTFSNAIYLQKIVIVNFHISMYVPKGQINSKSALIYVII